VGTILFAFGAVTTPGGPVWVGWPVVSC
jgi:hypothetical protein